MKKNIWILLAVVIILGSILRLWQLGHIPSSPDWDEASLGYDAYSILQTGKDQFGKFMPVVLRSFNDYKPALYAYFTIPSILIFGLNTFAVRFPSVVFGILSVFAVFYLVREIFENYKYRDYLAITSSFLLAISPLSIQFSRVAFESNIGTALNIFMALFFLKGLKKPWLLSLSTICAGLALYVYQAEKVFTPLLLLTLILLYWKRLISTGKKYLVSALIIGITIILPLAVNMLADNSYLERFRGTSVFSSQTELLKANLKKLDRHQQNNDKIGLLIDNRRFVYAKTVLQNYLSHFDLNWLFIQGDIARHHAHGMGIMYLFELPLLLLGIYGLLFGEFDKKIRLIVFLWILIAPIPASVTTGVPSAVRTLNIVPMAQVLTALGFIFFIKKVLDIKYLVLGMQLKYIIFFIFFAFGFFNISYYLNQYFVQSDYYDSGYWQYGYDQAIGESLKLQDKYQNIIVSNDEAMNQSYIFFLFYLKYPPQNYQKNILSQTKDVIDNSFGKYVFRKIDWRKDSQVKNVLYIANPNDIPDDVIPIKTIYNLDGTPAMKIVGT